MHQSRLIWTVEKWSVLIRYTWKVSIFNFFNRIRILFLATMISPQWWLKIEWFKRYNDYDCSRLCMNKNTITWRNALSEIWWTIIIIFFFFFVDFCWLLVALYRLNFIASQCDHYFTVTFTINLVDY